MQTPPGKQHCHEEMEVILLRKTHLHQERCTSLFAKMRTSLFANCSTFLFAKKRTLLFAVYTPVGKLNELKESKLLSEYAEPLSFGIPNITV